MTSRFATVIGLLACCLCGTVRAEAQTVSGRVVDASGTPVAAVEVATYWLLEGDQWKPGFFVAGTNADRVAISDEKGRFSLKVINVPVALLALDKERKNG